MPDVKVRPEPNFAAVAPVPSQATVKNATDTDNQEQSDHSSRFGAHFSAETRGSQLSGSRPYRFETPRDCARDVYINAVQNKISRLPPEKLSMLGGPFHYQIRAGSFGDVYDEVPWRVLVGLECNRGRGPIDRSVQQRSYDNGVLLNNCYEERRDRQYIRNHRTPISQCGYMCATTYGESIGKKHVCNKERAHLQTMKAYALSAFPAYQPELNVDMFRCCVPKPAECLYAEAKGAYHKNVAGQKRFDDAAGPPKEVKYNTKDLAKCKHW